MSQDSWIKVQDSIPDIGVDVLCLTDDDIFVGSIENFTAELTWWDNDCSGHKVTHWQPLPGRPQ